MEFKQLNLKPAILSALNKLEYTTPTKIQEEVITVSKDGKNIIGQSQTGTGKTAAFVISILERIDLSKKGVKALILAPTRELVSQIKEEIFNISENMRLRSLAVYGGEAIYKQIKMLEKGQDIVIGTPGRVIDLIERKKLKIEDVEVFVLDEVDRMLDMGFIDDIDFVWGCLSNLKQTLAFSATVTPEIKGIVEKYLGVDYTFIKAADTLTVAKIDHSFVEVPSMEKFDMLKRFIKKHKSEKTVVFVETKRDTQVLAERLSMEGIPASYLNGDMRQRERFKALRDFQENKVTVFVVTDVAARGLNMKNIDLVVNYHVPQDPESYIHRIGRTGRAGAEGKAIMMVSSGERFAFKNIEKRNKIQIKQVDEHGEEMVRKEERKEAPARGRAVQKTYDRFSKRKPAPRGERSFQEGNRQERAPFQKRMDGGDRRTQDRNPSFSRFSEFGMLDGVKDGLRRSDRNSSSQQSGYEERRAGGYFDQARQGGYSSESRRDRGEGNPGYERRGDGGRQQSDRRENGQTGRSPGRNQQPSHFASRPAWKSQIRSGSSKKREDYPDEFDFSEADLAKDDGPSRFNRKDEDFGKFQRRYFAKKEMNEKKPYPNPSFRNDARGGGGDRPRRQGSRGK